MPSAPRSPKPAPRRPVLQTPAEGGAGAPLATPSARRAELRVHDAILKALLSGALRPGTPLRERQLAQTFEATRSAVRKVLARLGAEGKLELRPQRGAFVPQPSEDDVRHVYELRRVLECGMAALLAERGTARETLVALDALLARARRAQQAGRRDEAVRLAGDFHTVLAGAFDNPELTATVQALVMRTQLFVALFESADAGACSADEHEAIVRALRRRDPTAALRAMQGDLGHVEQRVLARMPRRAPPPDLTAILRAALE